MSLHCCPIKSECCTEGGGRVGVGGSEQCLYSCSYHLRSAPHSTGRGGLSGLRGTQWAQPARMVVASWGHGCWGGGSWGSGALGTATPLVLTGSRKPAALPVA